jgi:hypothetical protein
MKKIIQDKQLLIRRIFLMCYDVLAVFAASIVALLIRFDLNIKSVPFQYMDEVWRALPFMIIVTLIISGCSGCIPVSGAMREHWK